MANIQVELIFPGTCKGEPIFFYIIKHFDLVPNIIEASFSTEEGWALVDFAGERDEIDRLLDFLKEKGVQINIR